MVEAANVRRFSRGRDVWSSSAPCGFGLAPIVWMTAALVVDVESVVGESPIPKRLRIKNACEREPIWIAHEAGASTGVDEQNIRIAPGQVFHFMTPAGLTATRYWPKMGCDEHGDHCNLGGSGGPDLACVRRPPEVKEDDYSRCAPPVDTKFEGTFDADGFDFVDMSLVDGWTLPFKLTLSGGECTGQTGTHSSITIDCSGLSFDLCPKVEKLTAAGITVDLRAVNPHTKEVAGCYAPCQKLVSGKWNNTVATGRHHTDPEVAPYCCPTPPETPEACRTGPIGQTSFLEAVHTKCPGVYGYAYDDGMGLLKCTRSSIYDLTFYCPAAPTKGSPSTAAPEGQAAESKSSGRTQKDHEAAAVLKLGSRGSSGSASPVGTASPKPPPGPPAGPAEPGAGPEGGADGAEAVETVLKGKALHGTSRVGPKATAGISAEGDLLMRKSALAPVRFLSVLQLAPGKVAMAGVAVSVGFVAIAFARRRTRHEDHSDIELIDTPEMWEGTAEAARATQSELRTLL